MSDIFDPYYKWLAIPPEEQPPDHYRLLGVKRFEPDADVIEAAADQRMIHLRNYQSGKQAAHSQRLLNEVASAKVTLLLPEKRTAYDEQLRRTLYERPLAPAAPAGSAPPPLPVALPLDAPPAAPVAPIAPSLIAPPVKSPPIKSPPIKSPPIKSPPANPSHAAGEMKPGATSLAQRRRKSSSLLVPTLVAGGVTAGIALLLLCAGGLYMLFGGGGDEPIAQNNPTIPTQPADDGDSTDGTLDGVDSDGTSGDGAAVDGTATDGGTADGAATDGAATDGGTSDGGTSDGVDPVEPMPTPMPMPTPVEPVPPMPKPPETPVTVDPPAPAPVEPKKLTPPSSEEQKTLLAQIDTVLKLSEAVSPEQKVEKYREMLAMARNPSSSSQERFALLRRAMETARDVGDATLTMRAIDEMDDVFEIDAINVRGAMLVGLAGKADSEDAIRSLMRHSESFIDAAVRDERADLALRLAEELHKQLSGIPAGRAHRKELLDQRTEVRAMHAAWQGVQDARKTLETNPDDAAANLSVGRYLSVTMGDFDAGVEHLAKGEDEALMGPAEKDLAAREGDDAAKLAAGDAWWEAVENGKQDDRFLARAHHWYSEVDGGQIGVLEQTRVSNRLKDIAQNNAARRLLDAIESESGSDVPMRVVAKDPLPLKAATSGEVPLAFSSDSKTLYTGGDDGAIKLWNADRGVLEQTWPGHKGRVNDLAVSPDGTLVSAGNDLLALLWNDEGKAALITKSDRSEFRAVAFSPEGRLAMARMEDVSFWDLRRRALVSRIPSSGMFFEGMFFSPDGNGIAALGSNKLALWGSNGQPLTLNPAQESCRAAAFAPDSTVLAMGPSSGKVLLYDFSLKTAREIDTPNSVGALVFSPDSKTLAVGYSDDLQLYDVASGQRWSTVDSLYIRKLAFSPDGKRLAVSDTNGAVHLWKIERERILDPPPTQADLADSDVEGANWALRGTLTFDSSVECLAFSPDSASLAIGDERTVRTIDPRHGGPQSTYLGHTASVRSIGWSPDGTRLVTGGDDSSTRLWDTAAGKQLGQLQGLGGIRTVGFSADGKQFVSIESNYLRKADVTAPSSAVQIDVGGSSSISSSAASSAGGPFAAVVRPAGRPQVNVYDFASSTPKATLDQTNVLAISDDGSRVIVTGVGNEIRVCEVATKKVLATFRNTRSSPRAAAFHPGGKMIAVGGYDDSVSLWSVETSKLIGTLSGHTGYINALAFSSDGKSLASASYDKTVKIWSPQKK
jgi:WD40 repeat protein